MMVEFELAGSENASITDTKQWWVRKKSGGNT